MTFVYCKDNYNHKKRQLAGVEFISQFIRSAKFSFNLLQYYMDTPHNDLTTNKNCLDFLSPVTSFGPK